MSLQTVLTDNDGVFFGRNKKTGKSFIQYPHGVTVLCSDEDLLNYMKTAGKQMSIVKERKYFNNYQYRIDAKEEARKLAWCEHFSFCPTIRTCK